MKQTHKLLKKGFESSSGRTPEFMEFCKVFKTEFTKFLTDRKCTKIEIGTGHFFVSGFFTAPNNQTFYFSLPDVRSYREGDTHYGALMYRTAKDYNDYTGGSNRRVPLHEMKKGIKCDINLNP